MMSTIIPLFLLALVSISIANYCHAIYYRRKVILPMVIELLNDPSADLTAQRMATHAFDDSLDFMLLIKMNRALKGKSEHAIKFNRAKFTKNFNTNTKNKIFTIIDECIRLNCRIAYPIYKYYDLTLKVKKVNRTATNGELKRNLISYANDECFR